MILMKLFLFLVLFVNLMINGLICIFGILLKYGKGDYLSLEELCIVVNEVGGFIFCCY